MAKTLEKPLWEQYKDALNFYEMFKAIARGYEREAEHLKKRMEKEKEKKDGTRAKFSQADSFRGNNGCVSYRD